jgi:hypothetical protein
LENCSFLDLVSDTQENPKRQKLERVRKTNVWARKATRK